MLIQGKLLSYGSDLSEALEIRRQVFVKEYQKSEEEEFDELDPIAMHVIVYEQGDQKKPVATGRIVFDGSACEIGHIAVLKEYRHRQYGDFVVRMLINKAFTAGIHEVSVKVPGQLIDFFRKIGFRRKNTNEEMIPDKEYDMTIYDGDVHTCCQSK
jgi:predicted GNAT family N-acyltransferase